MYAMGTWYSWTRRNGSYRSRNDGAVEMHAKNHSRWDMGGMHASGVFGRGWI